MSSVPFCLTVFRLTVALVVLPPLFFWLPWETHFGAAVLLALFTGFCALTDFFDGYVARRWCCESTLGRLLDPIADKVFVTAIFLFLLVAGRLDVLVVLVTVAREFLVTALREAAQQEGFSVPVSWMAKGKTLAQMVTGIYLLVCPAYYGYGWIGWRLAEIVLVWATVLLSLVSALGYVRGFLVKRGCLLE